MSRWLVRLHVVTWPFKMGPEWNSRYHHHDLTCPSEIQKHASTYSSGKAKTYLFFVMLGESFLSPSTTFLLRGSGLWTKVHSCLWNSHKTHSAAPSCITQRLFLRLQASQGRSLRERMLETEPLVEVGLPTTKFSLSGEGFCCLRGRAAAMGTGIGRGIAGCIAMAVVISVSGADDALKR
jgi:hypothetical protein